MPQNPFADPQESPTPSNPFADPDDPSTDPVPNTDSPLQAARAKLLTHTHAWVDVATDDINFVSSDVDDARIPKGLVCPEGSITTTLLGRVEGEDGECPLCEIPEVLERVENIEKMNKGWMLKDAARKAEMAKGKGEGKGKEKEKDKSIFQKTTRIGSAAVKSLKSVAGGKGKKEDIRSVEYETIGAGEGEGEGSKSSEDKKKKDKKEKKEKKERKEKPSTWSMYNPAGPSGYYPMWGPF